MQPKLSLARSWRRWPWWLSRKIWRARIILSLLAISGGLVFTLTRLSVLQINEVLISGSLTAESSARVKDLATKKSEGQNFFLLSSTKLENELLANFPTLRSIVVRKVFPHKLLLMVEQRTPLAIVEYSRTQEVLGRQSSVKTSYLIDREGIYFALAQEAGEKLLIIETDSELSSKVGEKASFEVLAALEVIDGLSEDFPDLVRVKVINEGGIEATVAGDIIVIFSSKNPIALQLATLRKVWGKYKMENKPLRRVDLRYVNPIVAF